MFSLLQVSFQGFLQHSTFFSICFASEGDLAFFAFKTLAKWTFRDGGGVAESKS